MNRRSFFKLLPVAMIAPLLISVPPAESSASYSVASEMANAMPHIPMIYEYRSKLNTSWYVWGYADDPFLWERVEMLDNMTDYTCCGGTVISEDGAWGWLLKAGLLKD